MPDGFVIAVASGKGGTGKTTIAANLAQYIATSDRPVQYLDGDVEEPNGHIFLKPKIDRSQQVTIDIPEVDLKKCIACGKCGEICQYSAIVCIKENVLTFEQLCHSCGGCMRVCPADAIKPKLLRIGDIEFGKAGNVDFISGKLCIGNVRTPSLIKEVKKHIKKDSLAIIDVPPGTSCPVVEAIKEANFVLLVTEPTPFGLNDLKLAVDLVRTMSLPFAVAINRYGLGNDDVGKYCKAEEIEIVLKLPDDRRIAEAYSTGMMIIEALPEYKNQFAALAKAIKVS
ncbi:MAG: ATP-binding protein [Phycisphaerae bacterium]|nr:ATP-binding protein [Phycisphaerae bacterium]MDD5380434.1 ATP-binding protein [Phycisphaerae bacterium]